MRFRKLALRRYGHFEQLDLELGGAPLVVVHGANEAGKSTLHSALLDFLFGVPARTPYAYRFGGPAIELGAGLVLADGDRLELLRRKGNKNTLTGERTGSRVQALTDGALAAVLGDVDAALYRSVFGFTLGDLQAGRELLKGRFADALAGASLGAGAQQVAALQAELDGRAAELFSESANARKTQLNKLEREARAAAEGARKATLSRREFDAAQDLVAAAAEREGKARVSARTAGEEKERLAQLLSRWEDLARLLALRARDRSVPVLDGEALSRAEELLTASRTAAKEAADATRRSGRIEARLRGREVDEDLLRRGDLLDELGPQAGEARALRAALPDRARRLADREEASGRAAAELGLTVIEASELVVALQDRVRVAELAAAEQRRRQDRERHEQAIRAEQRRAATQDEAAPQDAITPLAAQAAALWPQIEELDRQRAAASQAEERVARGQERLDPPWPDCDPKAALPSPERARSLGDRGRALAAAVERAQAEQTRAAAELQRTTRQAQVRRDVQAPPTAGELTAARAERQERWAAIRAAIAAGTEPPLAGFDEAVARADAVADAMRERAQAVADIERLEVARRDAEGAVEAAAAELDEAIGAHEGWRAQWAALWPVDPGSPDVMEAWLGGVSAVLGASAERAEATRRVVELEGECSALLAGLASTLGLATDTPWRQVRAVTEDRKLTAAERQGEWAEGQKQRIEARALLAEHEAQLAALARDEVQATGELATLAGRIGAAPGPAESLARHLDALEALQADLRDQREQRGALDQSRAWLAAFDERAEDGLPPDPSGAAPDVRVLALLGPLQKAREEAIDQRADERQLAEVGDEREAAERASQAATDELATLLQGVPGEPAEALRRSREQQDADETQRALTESLQRSFGDDLDAACARVEAGDRAGLAARLDEVRRDLASHDEVARTALQELTRAQEAVRALGHGAAAEAEAEAQGARARLAQELDDFLPTELARRILRRVVERYARAHRPQLLTRTSELLASLTGGRWVQAEVRPGTTELTVHRGDGSFVSPDQLSTGTREQLFVALRLAFVEQHCAGREPLPVLIDDAFVNFDTQRTRLALGALAEFGGATQVLYLTCHQAVADLARELGPKRARVLDLPSPD